MTKQRLTERHVLDAFIEEFQQRLEHYNKIYEASEKKPTEIDVNDTIGLLTPGLRLRHIKSGVEYTIKHITDAGAVLDAPGGGEVTVNGDELEHEYSLG
jgi:xanthine dehydrogenase molybdopterin-binding subunit B